jgi:predicted aspartyl protease
MRRWMLWAVLVLGNISAFAVEGQRQEAGTFEAATAVPFDLGSDFLVVVKGGIGNLEGLKFIVDTGSTWSVIDRKVAERLQVNRRAGRIMNFDRYISIEWADVTDFRMGPIRAENVRVMVMNLAKYSEFAKDVDGIIGLDLLSRSSKFTIDYDSRLISFQLAADWPRDRAPSGYLVIPVVVQGLTLHLAVDSGFPGVLLFRDRIRERLPKMRTEGESINVTIGRLRATRAKLPGVRMGGPELAITVFLIDGPDKEELPGIDGYLGPQSLTSKRIEFDLAASAVSWR